MSKFGANFSDTFGILGKKLGGRGGLTPKGKITKPAHFVFQSCWVVPSTWQSFIENGEMACITSACQWLDVPQVGCVGVLNMEKKIPGNTKKKCLALIT